MSNADEQRGYEPDDEMVASEPLGDADAVIENEPTGTTPARGGGEYPDPDTPPSGSAPADGSPERGKGTFDEAYEEAGPDRSGSAG
jgi:hypothetical protein